jgi:uncharacterized metal-binding protein YceD (DUF177 family)
LKIENQYIIHFKGLREGIHHFAFEIGKPFFEFFEHLEVPDGNLEVEIALIKKISFMELSVELSGSMQVQCDRCLEYFLLPVSFTGHPVVRFTETEKEADEDVIFLHPDDYQLDLSHYLYECLSLSMPIRKVHPDLPDGKSGCDPEMLSKLSEFLIEE